MSLEMCRKCLCNNCCNNVDCIESKIDEIQFACFNCDECIYFSGKGKYGYKETCEKYKQTEYKTNRIADHRRKNFSVKRLSKTHKIKIFEKFADDVLLGNKPFEVRKNDRDYQEHDNIKFTVIASSEAGDIVEHELNNKIFEITYILSEWGIEKGYVVLGIKEVVMYENKDKKCECWKCELKDTCQYKDKFQRLPRAGKGLGLCKKL